MVSRLSRYACFLCSRVHPVDAYVGLYVMDPTFMLMFMHFLFMFTVCIGNRLDVASRSLALLSRARYILFISFRRTRTPHSLPLRILILLSL